MIMAKSWKFLVSALAAGLVCGICAAVLFIPDERGASQVPSVQAEVPSSFFRRLDPETTPEPPLPTAVSAKILETAFANKEQWHVEKGARVLLVPHHLVAAREIASLFSSVKAPSVVYLVVPDHFGGCPATACSTDKNLGEYISTTSTVLSSEHAVTGLVPFILKSWGEVKIEPVMLRPEADEKSTAELISRLKDAMRKDKRALLVASIDASHYLPAEVADFHDELTEEVVTSLADKEVASAEIDAPAVLRVALKVARDFGLGEVSIHAHTNSLRLLQTTALQDSTSHFLASFSPGTIQPQDKSTMMVFGDMMFDRTVATRSKGDLSYPFKKIIGQEERFFRGQDLLLGNLEGPVTDTRLPPDKGNVDFMFNTTLPEILKRLGFDGVSQANNHAWDQGEAQAKSSASALEKAGLAVFGDQVREDEDSSVAIVERRGRKIALVGFNNTDNPLDRIIAEKTLASARSKADHLVVFMHWGEEYQAKPNKSQIDLAHWFVDQGVDAVIGGHPHWMQSVEVYRGRIIAYSLGNFVFDQDWSKETNQGLAVGLVLEGDASELYLYPVMLEKSQPRLLTAEERVKRLELLADISDASLAGQIKSGVIRTEKE